MIQNDRFVVIRSPNDQGAVVAKFDGGSRESVTIPDEIAESSSFVVQSLPGRSALNDEPVDQSGLTSDEREVLAESGYPID